MYSDFDDVLSDRDDDASCGDGYVPGSKIEQEESPRNPGTVTLKSATHFDPTIVLLAQWETNCDRKKDDYEFDSEGGTTMSVDMCAHYDHYVGNPYFEIRFIQ